MKLGKLLLVDDEILIRQGLGKLIENNHLNWSIVGEASNGKEALGKVAEAAPDLVLTDIRMPAMDGLELTKRLHEQFPDVTVIILTGYKDFEYAQLALKYGVADFLLKPCSEEDVVAALQRVYERKTKETLQRELELVTKRKMVESEVRSLFLKLPLTSASSGSLVNAESPIIGKRLVFLQVSSYFPETKSYHVADLGVLQFAVSNITNELNLEYQVDATIIPISYNVQALFIRPDVPIRAFADMLIATVDSILGIQISIRESGIVEDLRQLPLLYEEAVFASAQTTVPGEASPLDHEIDSSALTDLQNILVSYFMSGKMNAIRSVLSSIADSLDRKTSAEARKEALTALIALNSLVQKKLPGNAATEDPGIIHDLDVLLQMERTEQIQQWLESKIEQFLSYLARWTEDKNQSMIAKAIRYMEEHYSQTCTLKDAAESVHLNSNYLSNLFKKATGQSFINYLTQLRMDKAKVMLSNTNMKMFEISQAVGYDDPNYFATVFKQFNGESPSDYRRKSQREV